MASLIIWVCCLGFVAAVTGELSTVEMRQCLGCICHGKTKCNFNYGCDSRRHCGPFKIDPAYWELAGAPTVDGTEEKDEDAYMKCATDAACSSKTVVNYFKKLSQDCNGDGVVDCRDFLRLHWLRPPRKCSDSTIEQFYYYRTVNACLDAFEKKNKEQAIPQL